MEFWVTQWLTQKVQIHNSPCNEGRNSVAGSRKVSRTKWITIFLILSGLFQINFSLENGISAARVYAIGKNATATQSVIAVGRGPNAIAVNPLTNRIYVADSDGVQVINGSSNLVINAAATGGAFAVAVDPSSNRVYVGLVGFVDVLDGKTMSVVAKIAFTANDGRQYPIGSIAINSKSGVLYVGYAGNETENNNITDVSGYASIDLVSNKVISEVDTPQQCGYGIVPPPPIPNPGYYAGPVCATPPSLTVDSKTGNIYVSNKTPLNENLEVFDGSTNKLMGSFSASRDSRVAVNESTNRIYLTPGPTVISGTNYAVLANLQFGGMYVAVDSALNRIYVADGNGMRVIDGITSENLGTLNSFATQGGTSINGLALNQQTHRLYTIWSNGQVLVNQDNLIKSKVSKSSNSKGSVTCAVATTLSRASVRPAWYPSTKPSGTLKINSSVPIFTKGLEWVLGNRYLFLGRVPNGANMGGGVSKVNAFAYIPGVKANVQIWRINGTGDGRLFAQWATSGRYPDTTYAVGKGETVAKFLSFLHSLHKIVWPTCTSG